MGVAPARIQAWTALAAVWVLAALSLAGCGGGDSDGTTEAEATSATEPPTQTQPAAQPPAEAEQGKPAQPKPAQPKPAKPVPAPPSAAPDPCTTPGSVSRLRFMGLACQEAAAVATGWNRSPNKCNTIDDPSSPEGYNRTCELEGYTCTAKRDRKSEARFVACTNGASRVRFTWAPE